MIQIFRYNKIVDSLSEFIVPDIKTFVPSPTDDDYKRGYIVRYFVQKVNDENSYIYEIDNRFFNAYNSKPFFKTTKLDWKISGSDEDIKKSNEKSIRFASSNMKSLKFYLPNLLQFRKN
jgi:hypothetical protein